MGRLGCKSPKTKVTIPSTVVSMNFTGGDLHYALGHINFNVSGSCDVTMTCNDGCCASVAYSCFLSIKGSDLYDFAWDPSGAGTASGMGSGTVINNAAYVAQQNHKLGNYLNTFDFKHSASGSVHCPKKR